MVLVLLCNRHKLLLVNEVIAWTVIAVIISYIFEVIIRKIEQHIVVWN